MEVTIDSDPGGYFVEWHNTDNDTYSRWYGSRSDCEARAKQPPPGPDESWHPLDNSP